MRKFGGFTLIELMIAIAIIGILASLAIPRASELIRKSSESTTKGGLAQLRSALSLYYSENDGHYPTDDLSSLVANKRYMQEIPLAKLPPYHGEMETVAQTGVIDDGATGWAYEARRGEDEWGHIMVNCSHMDAKGVVWSSY